MATNRGKVIDQRDANPNKEGNAQTRRQESMHHNHTQFERMRVESEKMLKQ